MDLDKNVVLKGALAGVADYGSDSEEEKEEEEEEEVIHVPIETTKQGGEEEESKISNPLCFRNKESDEEEEEDLIITLQSDEDSDVEFNRILAITAQQRRKDLDEAQGKAPHKRSKKECTGNIEREYEKLPPIERLDINVDERSPMKYLGLVKNIVHCEVVIEADSGITLDYDSLLFRQDRTCIGQVYEVLGPVRCPLYTVRFNTPEEAQCAATPSMQGATRTFWSKSGGGDTYFFLKISVLVDPCPGMNESIEVFVALGNDEYTKSVFPDQLIRERHVDNGCVLNEKGDEEEVYSDDDQERTKNSGGKRGRRSGRGRGQGTSWPPRGGRGRGRGGTSFPFVDTRYMQ